MRRVSATAGRQVTGTSTSKALPAAVPAARCAASNKQLSAGQAALDTTNEERKTPVLQGRARCCACLPPAPRVPLQPGTGHHGSSTYICQPVQFKMLQNDQKGPRRLSEEPREARHASREVLDGLIVEQHVCGARLPRVVERVHALADEAAPLRDDDGERHVRGNLAGRRVGGHGRTNTVHALRYEVLGSVWVPGAYVRGGGAANDALGAREHVAAAPQHGRAWWGGRPHPLTPRLAPPRPGPSDVCQSSDKHAGRQRAGSPCGTAAGYAP